MKTDFIVITVVDPFTDDIKCSTQISGEQESVDCFIDCVRNTYPKHLIKIDRIGDPQLELLQ